MCDQRSVGRVVLSEQACYDRPVRAALFGLITLALTPGCRLGYDELLIPVKQTPDASQQDAGADTGSAGAPDAEPDIDAAVGGAGGSTEPNPGGQGGEAAAASGGAGAGGGGAPAAGDDAGAEVDEPVGDTGLRVSQILGFYSNLAWGDMVLRKQGDEIWGAYQYDGGTIVGTITEEGVFVGWWSQSPSRTGVDAGEVEFRWSQPDGGTVIKLDGRWRYGTAGTWLENWDVELVTDRAAPSLLTSRFDNPNDFKRHP